MIGERFLERGRVLERTRFFKRRTLFERRMSLERRRFFEWKMFLEWRRLFERRTFLERRRFFGRRIFFGRTYAVVPRTHLVRDVGVKAQDVAEALDELQRWISERARCSWFVGESIGPASAVLFDGGDRLQDLIR